MIWLAIFILSLGAYLFKIVGALVGVRREQSRKIKALLLLLPPALLSSLIALQTFELNGSLVLDARVVGVATGGILAYYRRPFYEIIVFSALVTAVVRQAL